MFRQSRAGVPVLLAPTLFLSLVIFSLGFQGVRGASYYYEDDGNYEVCDRQTFKIRMNETTDCAVGLGDFCDIHVDLYTPLTLDDAEVPPGAQGVKPTERIWHDLFPTVIFSTGFTVDTGSYVSYAKRLASWGYVVAVWAPDRETRGVYMTHRSRGLIAAALIDWVLHHGLPQVSSSAMVNEESFVKYSPSSGRAPRVFMIGHGEGAKSAMLAAEYDSRVVGVLGLDPVDCPPPAQVEDKDYPSSLPIKSKALTAWVGSEYGSSRALLLFPPCAPEQCNYQKFYNASSGAVSWEVLIKKSGSMQFCDHSLPSDIVCVDGDVPREIVRSVAHTVMVAWAECAVRRVNVISKYITKWADELTQAGVIRSASKSDTVKAHLFTA